MAANDLRGIPHRGADRRARLFGLGSVFGKTVRDARWPILVVAGIIGGMIVAGGDVMSTTYGAPGTRAELGAMSAQMPAALRGVYGNPVAVDTLGGFVSWHYASYFALIAGLWSILALSSTLAREARRGSLDLVVATQRSRRSIALEKVGGHVVAMGVAMTIVASIAWVTGAVFATMPGDEIPPGAAAAFALGVGARALLAGAIAFALATFLGRGAAAGIAGALMLGGYVVYGYRTVVPVFDSVAGLLWWSWTADHIPLAGRFDWPGVALTLALALALVAVGVEAFRRRDIGVTVAVPAPRLPGGLLGVGGPVARSLGDLLPSATWWGVGLAVYGAAMAAASRSLIDLFATSPDMAAAFRTMVPDIDLTTVGGFLQLSFADLGFLIVGLAAVALVADRWGEESAGRLELLLAAPLSRTRWAVATAVSLWLAIVLVTALLAGGVAVGAAATGGDATAAAGTLVLGLYAAALVGVGVAAGGILGPSAGAIAAGIVWVGTFLLDTLAPILRLPDWVAQLALTTHLGEPYVGRWDGVGIAACLVVAILGAALGAWGMSRRDIGR